MASVGIQLLKKPAYLRRHSSHYWRGGLRKLKGQRGGVEREGRALRKGYQGSIGQSALAYACPNQQALYHSWPTHDYGNCSPHPLEKESAIEIRSPSTQPCESTMLGIFFLFYILSLQEFRQAPPVGLKTGCAYTLLLYYEKKEGEINRRKEFSKSKTETRNTTLMPITKTWLTAYSVAWHTTQQPGQGTGSHFK